MKTIVMTLTVAALLLIGGAVAFMYSGIYDVSASTPHSAVSSWAMATTMHASVERGANEVDVPDLGSEELKLAGINDFESMCIGCHGAPGKERGPIGQGLNPPAPDLAESAAHMTPAELFWVTKHGIKMTGMPAWSATHADDALWPVVALMTALPALTAKTYAELLASAEGLGHHAGEAVEHEHNADEQVHEQATTTAPNGATDTGGAPAEHDHRTHEH